MVKDDWDGMKEMKKAIAKIAFWVFFGKASACFFLGFALVKIFLYIVR